MATEIFKELTFEAAHRLPNVAPDHKCARMHGHSYRVVIHVGGEVGETSGWVMDFADVSAAAEPVIDELDHQVLNEIEGLDNPTAEHIARWVWDRLASEIAGLSKIVVYETPTSGASHSA